MKRFIILFQGFLITQTVLGASFEFSRIVDSSGDFDRFSAPAVNNSGIVAFHSTQDSGVTGIYTGSVGQLITTVADTNATFLGFQVAVAINDLGDVAFVGLRISGGRAVLLGTTPSTLNVVADVNGQFASFVGPTVNNSRAVAFQAGLDGGGSGIFVHSAGVTQTVANSNGAFASFGNGASINDSGQIAFRAFLNSGGSGVYTSAVGESASVIAESDTTFVGFEGTPPTINSSGHVGFEAMLIMGSGVFRGVPGSPPIKVSGVGPLFNGTFDFSAINDAGQIASISNLSSGGGGIFIGPDFVQDRVIMIGDQLDGSTVIDLIIGQYAINDFGDIAFMAALSNGRNGIYIARPAPIPEPQLMVVLLVATAFWLRIVAWFRDPSFFVLAAVWRRK